MKKQIKKTAPLTEGSKRKGGLNDAPKTNKPETIPGPQKISIDPKKIIKKDPVFIKENESEPINIRNKKESKKILLECVDGCSILGLEVEIDNDWCNEEIRDEYWWTFWSTKSNFASISLWEKIKLCWKMFRNYDIFVDGVILNKDDTYKLYNFLKENL